MASQSFCFNSGTLGKNSSTGRTKERPSSTRERAKVDKISSMIEREITDCSLSVVATVFYTK
jgi:hypothetical protein